MSALKRSLLSVSTLVFTFVSISAFVSPKKLEAQSPTPEQTPYEKAYLDYQNEINVYNTAHADYILRRSQYLRFKTLQSQQDAFNATLKMLQERDQVFISYLTAIEERLKEAVGLDDQTKNELKTNIDSEIGWFTDHKNKLPSAGTLDDLVFDSNLARDRVRFDAPVYYQVLSTISLGHVIDFDQRLKDLFTQLKTELATIKSDQRPDYQLPSDKIDQLDRWVFDADNTIQRADGKLSDSQSQIATFLRQPNLSSMTYNNTVLRLGEAQQFLVEAGNYLTEIVRSIKTQD